MNKVKSRFQSLDSQLNIEELEQPIMKLKKRTRSLLPITAKPRVIRFFLLTSLTLFVSFAHVKAEGFGSLRVIVTNQNNTPIVQANLCFVLSTQTIGGKQTNQSGEFNATLPVGVVTLHIYKEGFANIREDISITNGVNLVRQFHLSPGTSTPLPPGCGTYGTTIPGPSGFIRITDFNVVGGTNTTNPILSLRATVDRDPQFYRITEFTPEERYPQDSFNPARAFNTKNVPWQPIPVGQMARDHGPHLSGGVLSLHFHLNAEDFGTHFVYLEVMLNQFGGISDPKAVGVVLAPTTIKTYTLTGDALDRFVQQSRQRGYRFQTTEDKVLGKFCLTNAMVVLPVGKARISDEAVEIIRGAFEVFIGPNLNPFWKLKSIDATHVDFPAQIFASTAGSKPALVVTKDITGSGGPNSIRRVFQWRRTVYPILAWGQIVGGELPPKPKPPKFTTTEVQCVLRSPNGASLTELTLEGPSGKNPIDALPRLP